MSKFMKFWLLIICFLFIFLIIFTDRVNASCITEFNQGYTPLLNQTKTANIGLNSYDIQLDNEIEWKNDYDTLEGQFWYVINDSYTSYSNINWNATCNSTQDYTTTSQQSYTITYGDGSHATISGRESQIDTICRNYNINGQLSQSIYSPQITTISMAIFKTNNTAYFCNVDKNGYFSCPKPFNGFKFDTVRFYVSMSHTSNVSISLGWFTRVPKWCTSDTQNIINNQNQNAQQQHNDAQQQYNYISNTTISNENYTNTQTISDNNTNTQTKSVVMNFWLIPLNFFNSIIASFENTCSQVCVGECGNGSGGAHDNAWRFIFPCLDIKGFVGNTIYNTIDAFFAVGMIFAFVKRAKNFFINALMLTNDVASEVSVF